MEIYSTVEMFPTLELLSTLGCNEEIESNFLVYWRSIASIESLENIINK